MVSELERMEDSVVGYGLWRKLEDHGGYSYWTDEIPCGFMFFDEGLADPRMIFEVLDRQGSLHQWLDSYFEHKEQYGNE